MKLQQERVLIKEIETKHPFLVLPKSQDTTLKGTVILVGDYVQDVKPGDVVYYPASSVVNFHYPDLFPDPLHLVSDFDILATHEGN